MPFVKASPNEYLVVGRGGDVVNLGVAVSTWVWPWWTWVLVPATKQEATFELMQETRDGIPLRFKGIVVYHVEDPVQVARLFRSTAPWVPQGAAPAPEGAPADPIRTLLGQVCMGELRHVVSHLTMSECIEQRKTTLTESLVTALRSVLAGEALSSESKGQAWGIELDVVQVAQVFIFDQDLRHQLEAERRNEIRSASELAEITAKEKVKTAEIETERRVQAQKLESERQRLGMEREKFLLGKTLEHDQIEAETPVRMLKAQRQREVAQKELELKHEMELAALAALERSRLAQIESDRKIAAEDLETERARAQAEQEKALLAKQLEQERIEADTPLRILANRRHMEVLTEELARRELEERVQSLAVRTEMLRPRAEQDLRREMLPVEQVPEIARALAGVLRGANLTICGDEAALMGTLAPVVEYLRQAFGRGLAARSGRKEEQETVAPADRGS